MGSWNLRSRLNAWALAPVFLAPAQPMLHASDTSEQRVMTRDAPPLPLYFEPLVVSAETPMPLDEIRWTVQRPMALGSLIKKWGQSGKDLVALNPHLDPGQRISAGQALLVYRHDPKAPTRSLGSPNAGRLRNGMPLPEGDGWRLRDARARAYGARSTIEILVKTFRAYATRFPDAPPVRVGEISSRRGGKARPHSSHRSGRDVDLGYILTVPDDGDTRWKQARASNFDAARNWYLIRRLVDSGYVDTIFMSRRLQKLLLPEAKKDLDEEQLGLYFRAYQSDVRKQTFLKHWRGHSDHMHVRFRCGPDEPRCR